MYKITFWQSEELLGQDDEKIEIEGNEYVLNRSNCKCLRINTVCCDGVSINKDHIKQLFQKYNVQEIIVDATYSKLMFPKSMISEVRSNWILDLVEYSDMNSYLEGLGKKTRQHSKNYRRRLEKYIEENKIAFQLRLLSPELNDTKEYEREYEKIMELIKQRFEVEASVRSENSKILAKCGYLMEYYFDDVLAAATAFYVYDSELYLQNLTFSYTYDKLNLGNLILLDTIQWAIEHGVKKFNMLWGDAEYKRQFGAEKRELYTYRIQKNYLRYIIMGGKNSCKKFQQWSKRTIKNILLRYMDIKEFRNVKRRILSIIHRRKYKVG